MTVMGGDAKKHGAQVIESYLDSRVEPVGTRLKLMCRLGCLPTITRLTREEKLYQRWECKLGGMAEEDTKHFVLECPAHSQTDRYGGEGTAGGC